MSLLANVESHAGRVLRGVCTMKVQLKYQPVSGQVWLWIENDSDVPVVLITLDSSAAWKGFSKLDRFADVASKIRAA